MKPFAEAGDRVMVVGGPSEHIGRTGVLAEPRHRFSWDWEVHFDHADGEWSNFDADELEPAR